MTQDTDRPGQYGMRLVRKRPVSVTVAFASTPGTCATLEGEIHYNAGDAIVTGTRGEKWPVGRLRFEATYEPEVGETPGTDGRYRKRPALIRGRQLLEKTTVTLSDGRGILTGHAGDWLVRYGEEDYAIIARDIFNETYDLIDEPAGGPAPANR